MFHFCIGFLNSLLFSFLFRVSSFLCIHFHKRSFWSLFSLILMTCTSRYLQIITPTFLICVSDEFPVTSSNSSFRINQVSTRTNFADTCSTSALGFSTVYFLLSFSGYPPCSVFISMKGLSGLSFPSFS